ncbi:peptide ABC transporter substrate-binding protein [Defluviimonas sp. WL0024]|uniref:Peptide ABC transporter substrate-binding protein n=2 Tax=Albidovulum TaxID=205889 RepID=A0ABT3J1N2_9RHOB|nr:MULTISPECIES: peptide ABC transporter substrate-binding protein [Defluviimonas]MCU9847382.1 peptide ABC transporter substrate-binding protein [Defluviimonas sp. WL0024]MCW3781573.1 peptide ABC transporter substrate-binding protein [Defluviimonas salinarum]
MNKLLLTTALGLSLALPAFAAEVQPGDTLAENQEYTYRVLDAIKSMDPQINTDVDGAGIMRSLFEGLYNEDQVGGLVPGVATSHELSDDKTTYTFHLRDNAKWSNGDPVTANDFVYAWKRLADPATASEYAWYMELMQVVNASEVVAGEKPVDELGVKAVDDHTLEVKITAPLPFFPKMLTHASTFPVNQKVVEAHGDKWTDAGNLVGNGAYVLKEHILGEKVVMERNPMYWDDAKTIITKATALTINDENAALTRYLAGELDRTDVPAGQYPRLEAELPDEANSVPQSCSYIYMFNLDEAKGPEALKDVNVRKALSYAIDRDIIVNNVLQGGQAPSYNWTHASTDGFEMPEIDYASWSQADRLAKAKELLAEAGYGPDNPLDLTLNYNTSEAHKKIAIAVQQFWKGIGVNLTLNNMEWKVHTDKMQNQDFEIARYAWCGDYNEASTYLDLFTSYSGHNNGKFLSADYDKLLKDSKTAENPAPLYKEAEQILAAEMPFAPIYQYTEVEMIKPDMRGMSLNNLMQNWYVKDMYRVAN